MHGKDKPINLLVIEDNAGDLLLLKTYLEQSQLNILAIRHCTSLNEALHQGDQNIDVVFLDLSLGDSSGLESFVTLNKQMPEIPIIVLSGLLDEQVAIDCIALGAQDYLMKNELNEKWLEKSVHYSIERKKNLEELKKINEQYEMIGNISNEVIWTWHLDRAEFSISKKTFLDYKPEEISNDVSWWFEKIHTEDEMRISRAMNDVMEGRKQHLQEEYRIRGANGAYRYLLARGVLTKNDKSDQRKMIGSLADVTETRKLHNELIEAQLRFQKQINEATILGQEKEKEEIGKELHDNVNQILTSIKLYLDLAIIDEEMKEKLIEKCRDNVSLAIEEIRRISHSLIPPSLGEDRLLDAIKDMVEEMNVSGKFKTHLSIKEFDESILDDNKKIMLFRIVQEQMNNIIKYSEAKEVFINFEMLSDKLMLTIADNGVGFDPKQKSKGIGLRNVESRVSYYSGELNIHSAVGQGTSLRILLPV